MWRLRDVSREDGCIGWVLGTEFSACPERFWYETEGTLYLVESYVLDLYLTCYYYIMIPNGMPARIMQDYSAGGAIQDRRLDIIQGS